jgi:hypothetical protein
MDDELLGAVSVTAGPELRFRLPESGVPDTAQVNVPTGPPTSERSTSSPTPRFVLDRLVGYVASHAFEICITLNETLQGVAV